MRFVEIRTVLVLMPHFAVSKTDEILSLSTGDHLLLSGTSISHFSQAVTRDNLSHFNLKSNKSFLPEH